MNHAAEVSEFRNGTERLILLFFPVLPVSVLDKYHVFSNVIQALILLKHGIPGVQSRHKRAPDSSLSVLLPSWTSRWEEKKHSLKLSACNHKFLRLRAAR